MEAKAFLKFIEDDLLHQLRRVQEINKLTSNTALLGAFAEGLVRDLVARLASPMRLCQGAVIDHGNDAVRQIDAILWIPCPAPPVCSAGDFGLVPRGSVMGVMEIKKGAHSSSLADMHTRLGDEEIRKRTATDPEDHAPPVPDFLPGFGVICVKEKDQNVSRIQEFLDSQRCVILFEKDGEELEIVEDSAIHLLNFITKVRARAKFHDGLWTAVPPSRFPSKIK